MDEAANLAQFLQHFAIEIPTSVMSSSLTMTLDGDLLDGDPLCEFDSSDEEKIGIGFKSKVTFLLLVVGVKLIVLL